MKKSICYVSMSSTFPLRSRCSKCGVFADMNTGIGASWKPSISYKELKKRMLLTDKQAVLTYFASDTNYTINRLRKVTKKICVKYHKNDKTTNTAFTHLDGTTRLVCTSCLETNWSFKSPGDLSVDGQNRKCKLYYK